MDAALFLGLKYGSFSDISTHITISAFCALEKYGAFEMIHRALFFGIQNSGLSK